MKSLLTLDTVPAIGELLPFEPSNAIELEQLGLDVATLEHYRNSIAVSSHRKIPVFKYRDRNGKTCSVSAFSCTYRRHIPYSDNPSFFYLDHIPSLVERVVICPDPIELMSYHQLYRPYFPATLLIAPSPFTPSGSFGFLKDTYPHAEYQSIYPLDNKLDILHNLCLTMTLNHKNFTLIQSSGTLEMAYGKGCRNIAFNDVNISLYRKVKRKKIIKLKHVTPPSGFTSFNSLL